MTEKLHFEIDINSPAKIVWDTMLSKETYEEWTTAFDPSSTYEGSWDKGSTIKFVSSESGDGMLSEIADNIKYKYISIRHLGEIKDGTENISNGENTWTSAYENYTFTEHGPATKLEVDLEMEATKEFKEIKKMFEEMWPKALMKLKEICER